MKIRLEIEFEVPDKLSKFSEKGLRETFWEEFLRYAVVSHLEDAVHWAINKTPNSDKISEHHQLWGDYLDKGKITAFEVIKPAKKVDNG